MTNIFYPTPRLLRSCQEKQWNGSSPDHLYDFLQRLAKLVVLGRSLYQANSGPWCMISCISESRNSIFFLALADTGSRIERKKSPKILDSGSDTPSLKSLTDWGVWHSNIPSRSQHKLDQGPQRIQRKQNLDMNAPTLGPSIVGHSLERELRCSGILKEIHYTRRGIVISCILHLRLLRHNPTPWTCLFCRPLHVRRIFLYSITCNINTATLPSYVDKSLALDYRVVADTSWATYCDGSELVMMPCSGGGDSGDVDVVVVVN